MYSFFPPCFVEFFPKKIFFYLIPVEKGSYWANLIFTLVTDIFLSPLFCCFALLKVFLLYGCDVTSRLGRCNEVWTGGYIKTEWRRSGKTKAIFDNRLCPAGYADGGP